MDRHTDTLDTVLAVSHPFQVLDDFGHTFLHCTDEVERVLFVPSCVREDLLKLLLVLGDDLGTLVKDNETSGSG